MDRKKRAILILPIILVIIGAYWFYNYYFIKEDKIQATGTIEATTVETNAKLSGTIKNIEFEEGDNVQKDQLVAELLRNDLVAQKERDKLTVTKAEVTLADLLSGAREQEIREAIANVNIAKANYKKTEDDFKRYQSLLEIQAISQSEFDNAQTALEVSKNTLEAAEAKLSLLEEGSRKEQIELARTEVERSKAVLKATEALVGDLKIFAPLSGQVISKNYEEGEYVQMGASVLTIANLDDLWIRVYIPTDELPLIKLGQKVKFSVSGISQEFEGVVEEIASKGEFTPKTIQTKQERANVVFGVKIRITSEGGILKPGMPADVTF